MAQSVKHKRSAVLVNGSPKLPTTSQLEVGEIAINFAEGYETLSTRNNNNGIATFSSDAALDRKYISSGAVVSAISAVTQTIEDNEYVIAQAFNSQNDRLEALEESQIGISDIPTEASIQSSGFTKNALTGLTFNGSAVTSSNGLAEIIADIPEDEVFRVDFVLDEEQGTVSASSTYNEIVSAFNNGKFVFGRFDFFGFPMVMTASTLNGYVLFTNVNISETNSGTLNADGFEFKVKDDNTTDTKLYDYTLMTDTDRNYFLSTGATLDDIADGATRKLSNYSLTSHTHSEYASTGHSHTAAEVGALSTATTYFDDVEYDSSTKRINFKKNSSVIDYVDATNFIKDGMVSSVTVSNGNLVVSFNTEAGREDITLALTQIFNPNNYYDKTTADGKFLTGYTETDPTVPAWAKATSKPTYTASEVGALPSTTHVPTEASIANSGFTKNALTAFTETDPTVPSWAKQSSKPTYTASEVGALPTGTTLDNIADGSTRKLSDYSLTSHTHSQYASTAHTHTAAEVGALPSTTEIPTQASILSSGFTKNAGTLTGVTINGSAATVSNGNASFNIELGGSGSGLPTVSASDNGKILQVVDGQWTLVTPTVVYTGNGTPDNVLGNDGDIYLQTS